MNELQKTGSDRDRMEELDKSRRDQIGAGCKSLIRPDERATHDGIR